MRMYLSGPMTGLVGKNVAHFNTMSRRLHTKGFDVFNPAVIPHGKGYAGCMKECLPAIFTCQTMAVLKGWEKSKGARLEVAIARAIDMPVVDAYTLERCEKAYTLDLLEHFVNGHEKKKRAKVRTRPSGRNHKVSSRG